MLQISQFIVCIQYKGYKFLLNNTNKIFEMEKLL